MRIKNLIKKIIPKSVLTAREKKLHSKAWNKIYNTLSTAVREKYQSEINYLVKMQRLTCFPYEDLHMLDDKFVIVRYGDGYPYVYHRLIDESNYYRLYFPSNKSKQEVQMIYSSLLLEQAKKSPHLYFDDNHKIESDNVLFDIGAAEGIVALSYINKYRKAYIFEGDQDWIIPLRKTFEPFGNKVQIIDKFVSDEDTESSVTLAKYVNLSEGVPFIKMDIEGMEMQVLNNIKDIIKNINCKASVCVYHRPDDAENIRRYFEELGYDIRYTSRYMFLDYNDDHYSFRKGVLYASKSL